MSPRPAIPDPGQTIARAAAEWVARIQEGLTPAEEARLADWLRADPRHEEIFAEMSETSSLLDRLREPTLAEVPAPPPAVSRRRYLWHAASGLAAAAALAIAYLGWNRQTEETFTESAATEVGVLRSLELPDGTVVRLNTASAVTVHYTAAQRRVRLTAGEAFFSVAKNPHRPFYVEAGTVSVRAVGTAFNVRLNADDVVVVVSEGKVAVGKPDDLTGPEAPDTDAAAVPPSRMFLTAGQKITIPLAETVAAALPAAAVHSLEAEDVTRTLAWTENRLQFESTPLAEIVAEFNRYNRERLVIGDSSLATLRFGGSFTPTGYASFVELLEQDFGIVAERNGDEIVLRKPH